MSQPKKQGNYFMLPNEIFNMDLSSGEIALYAFLMRMEDRKTYSCYPSFKTIGNALHMSKNTVMKYVRQLKEKELIETERTLVENREGALRNGNLMYKILPIKRSKRLLVLPLAMFVQRKTAGRFRENSLTVNRTTISILVLFSMINFSFLNRCYFLCQLYFNILKSKSQERSDLVFGYSK